MTGWFFSFDLKTDASVAMHDIAFRWRTVSVELTSTLTRRSELLLVAASGQSLGT
jgi:hypothetical protein